MHPQYPLPDIKHLIDRLHTKGALRFLDLEISGPTEICPGVTCEAAGEKAAIKKLLSNARFVLPVHDRPAKVEGSQIVGRLQDAVPGPLTQSLAPRNWFPA
jgi:hypothetical protein